MLSLNYQFNEDHSVGIRYDYDRTPKDKLNFNPMQSDVFQDDALYEQNTTSGWQKMPSTSHTLNVYYNGQAGDWNIDFNADGLWSYSKTLQDMNERYIPTGEAPQEQRVTSYNKDENTLYAAKLIISRPLWEGNLSFGGEYTYTDHVNTYINDQGILDDDHSDIRENNASAFLEYARTFGKLQAQAGVRYEHLTSDYYENNVRMDEQSRTYDNVFPSLALALPVGKTQLSLSYTGSISRPSYYALRSNITYANRYTYEGGNPLLRPSLIHRLSADVSWKWIYFNAHYTHIKDFVIQQTQAYSEDNPSISLVTYLNKGNADNLSLTLSLSPTFGPWSPQLTLMMLQQWYMVDMPVGIFTWRNNVRLPWGLLLDVDASLLNTRGDQENCHLENIPWSVDIGLRKAFLNDRLSLQLQGRDLFNSAGSDATLYGGDRLIRVNPQSRRSITLTLRYKFNPAKSKYKGTGAGQDQRSRM